MAEYNSDEERFAAVVNFFKDTKNIWLITFAAILAITILVLGTSSYQNKQNIEASTLYDSWFAGMSDSQDLEANQDIFDELQSSYSGTGYSQLARMIRGSQLAKKGDLQSSVEDFKLLAKDTSGFFGNDVLNTLARINSARIELSNENFSEALGALEPLKSSDQHPMIFELKGDALAGMNKIELAITQYNLALESTPNKQNQSMVKIKINNLTQ